MSVCQLRIGDGRDEIHERSADSLSEMAPKPDHVVVIDDRSHELGFAGAIAEGWRQVIETGADFVWHAEMDFIYCAPVPLERMIAVLEAHPYLAQMALKRQAVNELEIAAGGVVEARPTQYEQRVESGDIWTEHRVCFTTNPSVYPVNLCHQGWPQRANSEGIFSARLRQDPKVRFGYWGAKHDQPMVEHIGRQRAGVGY